MSGGKEKWDHEWQQAEGEAAHFIKALCPQGGIVCDPMCGSGTVCAAAAKQGFRHLGFDIDVEAVEKSRARIAELT